MASWPHSAGSELPIALRGVEIRFLAAEAAMGGPLKKKEMIRAQVGTVARAAGDTALNVVERVNAPGLVRIPSQE